MGKVLLVGLFGSPDERRVLNQPARCCGHNFCGINHALMRGRRLSLRDRLPGMERCPDGTGGDARLNRGDRPTHIPHVRRSLAAIALAVERRNEIT